MMLHILHYPFTTHSCNFPSFNFQEEKDENMNKSDTEDTFSDSRLAPEATSTRLPADHTLPRNKPSHSRLVAHADSCSSMSSDGQSSYSPYQPPLGLPSGYSPKTPFPSQVEGCFSTLEPHNEDWLQSRSYNSSVGGYSSGSHLSCLVSGDYCTYRSETCCSPSLSENHSPGVSSLEQPHSLHSIPTTLAQHGFYLAPCSCSSHGPPCSRPDQQHAYWDNPHALSYHMPWSSCPKNSKQSDQEFIHRHSFHPQPRSTSITPLSLEQRKVFVTYEADCDKHVKEVINFVALLRHNGFYTHIDMFEQQFRSINKIDFMERYITEKDYLIIIIISPKYYEIVTRASLYMENDETLNTVYIHKQLQNEFIQNGCKNFRFVPVLFPGAKKNTHIFSWPRDRDDILRRLMRVEKYNPPPIGQLPTIVSIPI
ncbi:adapter protein CIKS isoform X2 [Electrophorus electricus]|uniref:adapter protein CIKS isoform X2 n=1 Tax=Electrophorus electricus TaxID=8005 RepID=UPI0015D06DD6|nr:adapter protein CIKS isoform X2 [Electrophorus electricus]